MAKEKICGVYKIENEITGRFYIGSSKDIASRFCSHKWFLQNISNGHTKTMQSDCDTHGVKSFRLFILEKCPKENLCERENYYLQISKAENPELVYNISPARTRRKDWRGKNEHQ